MRDMKKLGMLIDDVEHGRAEEVEWAIEQIERAIERMIADGRDIDVVDAMAEGVEL